MGNGSKLFVPQIGWFNTVLNSLFCGRVGILFLSPVYILDTCYQFTDRSWSSNLPFCSICSRRGQVSSLCFFLLPSLWGIIYLFAQTLRIGMLRIPLSSWWMDLQSVLADAPVIAVTSFKSEVAAQEWHSSPGSMALGTIFLPYSKWALTLQIPSCLCQPM